MLGNKYIKLFILYGICDVSVIEQIVVFSTLYYIVIVHLTLQLDLPVDSIQSLLPPSCQATPDHN